MSDYLFCILQAVIIIVITLLTKYIIPWLKGKAIESDYAWITDIVTDCVLAAEQTIRDSGKGATKKDMVTNLVKDALERQHVEISEAQLDALIESAVYAMKEAQV